MTRIFFTCAFFLLVAGGGNAQTERVIHHEFSKGLGAWVPNAMVTVLGRSPEGVLLRLRDPDPFIVGPAGQYPQGKPLTVTIRMRSTGDPVAQIYYGAVFDERKSIRFEVNPDGQWHEYTVFLPALTGKSRIRFDPPCSMDPVELAWIRVEVGAIKPTDAWARPSELRGKKMIAGGQFTTTGGDRAVTSRYLARNPEFTARFPFDGIVIPAVIDAKWSDEMKLPREERFLHGVVWNATRIPPAAIDAIAGELNSVNWRGVTDNFLNYSMIDGTRGRHMPDLSDDRDWAILEHNARQAARLCRLAGMKGFWLDTEQYGNYRWRTETGEPEFDTKRPADLKFPLGKDSPEVLRKRGIQWIRCIQEELPAVKIIITFAWSPDANEYGPIRGANGFLNGVLDGIRQPAQLIHGYENTFYFGQGPGTKHTREGFPGGREQFEKARANIRHWRSFSANPAKYDIFLKTGMAAWVEDDPWALWDGWPSGGPESFWSNLPMALAHSDEYVWVWSEHTRYEHRPRGEVNPFLASLGNRTFNTGKEQVSLLDDAFLTDPLQKGWHFDFDMLDIAGAKKPGHQVQLMSLENIPYRWQAANRAIEVRALPAIRQRRRFVHPLRVPAVGEGFHASFRFQPVACDPEFRDGLLLGMFTADFPAYRESLSVRLKGGGNLIARLEHHGFSHELALSVPGGIAPGKTYLLAFDKEGAKASLRVALSEATGGDGWQKVSQVEFSPDDSMNLPGWDEVGFALEESPPSASTPGEAPLAKAPKFLVNQVNFKYIGATK